MKAFIICANDKMFAVVLNDEKRALKELTRLSDNDYNMQSWNFENSRELYDIQVYWHLHEVDVLD